MRKVSAEPTGPEELSVSQLMGKKLCEGRMKYTHSMTLSSTIRGEHGTFLNAEKNGAVDPTNHNSTVGCGRGT